MPEGKWRQESSQGDTMGLAGRMRVRATRPGKRSDMRPSSRRRCFSCALL
jgi:hypothetical protein